MTFFERLTDWICRHWVQAPQPTPRPRHLRGTCAVCGKNLAVVASANVVWKHKCKKPDASA